MFDSFGNSSNDSPLRREHLDSIRATGVHVEEFDPLRFPWINHAYHRDHRKIVVIDGQVCFTGGMNVADYYIHGRPEYGEWRDMHMQLTGDAVAQYERIFARMWWQQSGEIILYDGLSPTDVSQAPKVKNGQVPVSVTVSVQEESSVASRRAPVTVPVLPDLTPTAGQKVIGVVDRRPRETSKNMRRAYVAAEAKEAAEAIANITAKAAEAAKTKAEQRLAEPTSSAKKSMAKLKLQRANLRISIAEKERS